LRPLVKKDRAAVPAEERAVPSDTTDSQQRVFGRVAALMQASTLGAERVAPGSGGELGAKTPGTGSPTGWGARSTPSGHGAGLDVTPDPGLEGFYRRVLARVEEALYETFPRWAIAEGRGGLVVFDLTLVDNGRVQAVAVVRPSGIPEYDENVLQALRRLPTFGPVPSHLGSRPVLRIDYDARNPIVGRSGPGPGRRPE
jgi:TonB family protein